MESMISSTPSSPCPWSQWVYPVDQVRLLPSHVDQSDTKTCPLDLYYLVLDSLLISPFISHYFRIITIIFSLVSCFQSGPLDILHNVGRGNCLSCPSDSISLYFGSSVILLSPGTQSYLLITYRPLHALVSLPRLSFCGASPHTLVRLWPTPAWSQPLFFWSGCSCCLEWLPCPSVGRLRPESSSRNLLWLSPLYFNKGWLVTPWLHSHVGLSSSQKSFPESSNPTSSCCKYPEWLVWDHTAGTWGRAWARPPVSWYSVCFGLGSAILL